MWVSGQIVHDFEDAIGGVKESLAREDQPHLFDRLSWFKALWAHNRIGARPLIARAWCQGARAWLFLAQQDKSRATALANYYTLAFRPIFTGEPDETMRKTLMIAIARRLRAKPHHLAHICLSPVPQVDGSSDVLVSAFRQAGWRVNVAQKTVNWTANVAGMRFDDYWAARPGELRSTYARKVKKSTVKTEVHSVISDEIWAEYESIYAESWKPEEGSTAFLRHMAEEEGAACCLRLGIARIDGVAVAAQLWTLEPAAPYQRAIIHKLAYRESAALHSPGTILTHTMFRHVIDEDKVPLIDYGTGDDRYKAAWMDTRNLMDQLDCYNISHPIGLWLAVKARVSRLRLQGLLGAARLGNET